LVVESEGSGSVTKNWERRGSRLRGDDGWLSGHDTWLVGDRGLYSWLAGDDAIGVGLGEVLRVGV